MTPGPVLLCGPCACCGAWEALVLDVAGGLWACTWGPGGWWCECTTQGPRCWHVRSGQAAAALGTGRQ